MKPVLARLRNPVRHYDWGSHEVIARLEGRSAPTALPEAELWLGGHPTDPSEWLLDDAPRALDAAVAADPEHLLGPELAALHGPRLPFLLKVLAVSAPLSLQAHPDAAQAEDGFAREEALGRPLRAEDRSYTDPWPKPELVRAITPFDALCGFRAVADTLRLLEILRVPGLDDVVRSLRERGAAALPEVLERLLLLPDGERAPLVADVGDACRALDATSGYVDEARWVAQLAHRYPADPGVVVALLLELVQLAPGDAMHVPAGTLHSYLSGTVVEIMASSDNVLRGGLTSKYVDVPALLDVVTSEPCAPIRVTPTEHGPERVHPVPVEHFRLSELHLDGEVVALDDRGPQILLVTDGHVRVSAAGEPGLDLAAGGSAFVAAAARTVHLDGHGTVFRATAGEAVDDGSVPRR